MHDPTEGILNLAFPFLAASAIRHIIAIPNNVWRKSVDLQGYIQIRQSGFPKFKLYVHRARAD
jgi:hypothetical protein